jgi:hypothetical protein
VKTVASIDSYRKKRFTDFADEPTVLDGAKVRIDDVLNVEIEIIGYRLAASKFTKNKSGLCLTLQFNDPGGQRKILFTGSDVLIDQIKKYEKEIPFIATIKKVDRYYLLS